MARILSVKVPDELYEEIENIAKRMGVTVSEAVRQALQEYITRRRGFFGGKERRVRLSC